MRLLSNKRTIYAILITGVAVLAALNFWGWFFVKGIEVRILDQLARQLQVNSEIYELQLSSKYRIDELLLLPPDHFKLVPIQQELFEFQQASGLTTIFIVSPDGQRFITSDLRPEMRDRVTSFSLNDSLFHKAQIEAQTYVERNVLGDQYFLTAYTPLVDEFGLTTAVLIVEAPAELVGTLAFFRNTLVYSGVAGVTIIVLFAGLIVLAIRRLFQIEATLHRQSRLAHLGQMAAMVAHEIRNPLSIIKGSAEVLRKKYSSTGEPDELLNFIPDEINRLNRLVNDFLQFARQKEMPLIRGNLHEMVSALVRQINDERLRFELAAAAPMIPFNEDAMRQALLNIIENARQSTPPAAEGGQIAIRSEISPRRPRRLILTVADNGAGMAPETLQRIFEPFFSTRATGSGLGMAITRQLIEQMNGTITVESVEKKGTTVTLTFPM